jgi:hypothetical protein
MLKQEFEALALRNGETISVLLFETIEHFYMSRNNYHRDNVGIDETKQAFVKMVFGGKVNTKKSVLRKIIAESLKEQIYCIGQFHTKDEMDETKTLLTEYYSWKAEHDY